MFDLCCALANGNRQKEGKHREEGFGSEGNASSRSIKKRRGSHGSLQWIVLIVNVMEGVLVLLVLVDGHKAIATACERQHKTLQKSTYTTNNNKDNFTLA